MSDERASLRRCLTEICQAPIDVLVIGGGIVGVGVARDAASQGLGTLLVEQADIASGTSSRSSRPLHDWLAGSVPGHETEPSGISADLPINSR